MTVQKAVNNAIYEVLTGKHIEIFNTDLMVRVLQFPSFLNTKNFLLYTARLFLFIVRQLS